MDHLHPVFWRWLHKLPLMIPAPSCVPTLFFDVERRQSFVPSEMDMRMALFFGRVDAIVRDACRQLDELR